MSIEKHEDIQEIMFSEENLRNTSKRLGKQITDHYKALADGKELVAVVMLNGASIFFADLVRNIELPIRLDCMLVSSYLSSTISSGKVSIKKDLDGDIRDKHILLVEDIIDSGFTMECVTRILKDRGAASVKLCALMNKPSRRKIEVNIDFLGYDVEDEFVVGYGLDYAERYRNLPYIGVLKREIYSE